MYVTNQVIPCKLQILGKVNFNDSSISEKVWHFFPTVRLTMNQGPQPTFWSKAH